MNQSDAALRDLVSTTELEASVAHLCGIGEKVSGTEEERKACDFITSRLKAWGYTPTVHTFESYISAPRSAKLSIHAGGKTVTVPAVGVAFGLSTGPDGITEDVVFVGPGTDADYVGKDVAGKIVLVSKLPSPNNAVAAAAHGARGMICMSAGHQRHKMIITPVWGTPEFDQAKSIPRVHVVSIAKTDGDPVIEMLKAGPVSVARTGPAFSISTTGSPSVLAIDTTCTRGMLFA